MYDCPCLSMAHAFTPKFLLGARWFHGRAPDFGVRGSGFKPHDCSVVSLSKTLKVPKSNGKYQGSGGSVPT